MVCLVCLVLFVWFVWFVWFVLFGLFGLVCLSHVTNLLFGCPGLHRDTRPCFSAIYHVATAHRTRLAVGFWPMVKSRTKTVNAIQASTNQKPETRNQKPETRNQKPPPTPTCQNTHSPTLNFQEIFNFFLTAVQWIRLFRRHKLPILWQRGGSPFCKKRH